METIETVGTMLDALTSRLAVHTVFGEPIERDGVTLVPVASVRGGGGGGVGEEGEGSGSGFGLSSRPVGAFVIHDGEVEWKPAVDVSRTILGGQLVGAAALFVAWRLGAAVARRWAG